MSSQFVLSAEFRLNSDAIAVGYVESNSIGDLLIGMNSGPLSLAELLQLGQWSRSAYWTRTVVDDFPRLKEQLRDWEIPYEVIWDARLGYPLGLGGRRLIKSNEHFCSIEPIFRSLGGGSPRDPQTFRYGPYRSTGGIRLTIDAAKKLLAAIPDGAPAE